MKSCDKIIVEVVDSPHDLGSQPVQEEESIPLGLSVPSPLVLTTISPVPLHTQQSITHKHKHTHTQNHHLTFSSFFL